MKCLAIYYAKGLIENILQKCTYKQLEQIHALVITTSLDQVPDIRLRFLRRSTEYGEMDYASLVFSQMGGLSSRDITLWNAMIRGYAYNGFSENGLSLFVEMPQRDLKPNNFTYPYVLNACSQLGLFRMGQSVHCQIIKSGFECVYSVGNALYDFYVKRVGNLSMDGMKNENTDDVRKSFEVLPEKTVEIWNKLVGVHVKTRNLEHARQLFDEMPNRDTVSWNTMISAYAKAGEVAKARGLFRRMPYKNVVTWTTMLGLYADAGDVEMAREIFEKMPEKNVVSWNSMMSSYTKKKEFQSALDLFVRIQQEDVEPDSFTYVSALTACSNLNNLEVGRWVHSLISDWPKMGVVVGTALVEMYANCGDIEKSFAIFIKIGKKYVFCYNVMIKSLAIHGRSKDAIRIFRLMKERGLEPNEHTYSSVLFACSHGGLVKEGRDILKALERNPTIRPRLEHYCCVIDLLCRNDRLEEAEILIREMEVEPDVAIWGALLGGCRDRGNLKLGESIVSKAIELERKESGVHVLLSNIHASVGQWPEALRTRKIMEENGIWKRTGGSSII